jgi:hypothetical protein
VINAMLAAFLWAGCAAGAYRYEERMVDPKAICRLVDGNLEGWRGLGQLDFREIPSCVGFHIEHGTTRFQLLLLAADTYRAASGRADVRLYWAINGGAVELVEVLPTPARDTASLLAELGAPALTHVYSADERTAANLPVPRGGSIEEAVYDGRGLAVALARDPARAAAVVRIRGFRPMPAEQYLDAYVRFEPEAL